MFDTVQKMIEFMKDRNATRILYKCLSENDNTKQQIYLGGSFEALNRIPFGVIREDNCDGAVPNFKATLNFNWISDDNDIVPAPKAQLILYPKYPEVRLSGFLHGCSAAPRNYLQPIVKDHRSSNNSKDGRVLVLGLRADGMILATLFPADTNVSKELSLKADSDDLFTEIDMDASISTRRKLIEKLSSISRSKWLPGSRLDARGILRPYQSSNAGGYTLEAQMGITPNGRPEPDWHGWELKAYTNGRITLMTPEPNGGLYGLSGVEAFVRKYGYTRKDGTQYFTGIHSFHIANTKTGMSLLLDGYDSENGKIKSVSGGLVLMDSFGEEAAFWSFSKLMEHWGKKHAHVAYVPYKKQKRDSEIGYLFGSPVLMGENGDFTRFLKSFSLGMIVLDPAPKIYIDDKGRTKTKARNQFRIKIKNVHTLYERFDAVDIQ